MTLPPPLRPVIAPAAILLAAALVLAAGSHFPDTLSGLRIYAPFALLILGAGAALWFNRGRAFVALASLLVAYGGYRYAYGLDPAGFAEKAAYAGLAVFVPLNVFLALLLPERGIVHHGSYRWLLLIAAETLLVAWIGAAGRSDFSGESWHRVLDHWSLRGPQMPWLGRILFVAAFVAAIARAWVRHTPLEVGLAGALVAFFIACEWMRAHGVPGAFVSAAGVILIFAILQESHRMAFEDELTGLPSRRALEERLRGLGPAYAIAMIDVDHFKEFNDRHGHDVGDQVLKLVAARLEEVGGGGKAFRYGGEEFTVLFPGKTLEEALPHLEAIRAAVADYKMAVRGGDRPKDPKVGSQRRGIDAAANPPADVLSVTVSIGVAEPSADGARPEQVVQSADRALYRAKEAGRNRVSR